MGAIFDSPRAVGTLGTRPGKGLFIAGNVIDDSQFGQGLAHFIGRHQRVAFFVPIDANDNVHDILAC